ncbi:hypothetical protein ACSBM8_01965 [Sphingomonas sp. ASY06-1R]|uniref:hypothetical protein n=1 Tax=Sphingomonas sp. ASY06-1R TaxID=3445771 RepID=UPI003FA28DA6
MIEGPPLERLTRRLAETPGDFLADPIVNGVGQVATAALVHDLLAQHNHDLGVDDLRTFLTMREADRNRLRLAAVVIWLLAEESFANSLASLAPVMDLLTARTAELAATGKAEAYVADPERREELARTALAALAILPASETEAQAADRLSAVSAAERNRLLNASRDAEERARAIREALVRKAAEESADKYTRE